MKAIIMETCLCEANAYVHKRLAGWLPMDECVCE